MDVRLHIVLVQPPAGVDFGVQKGHGSGYEVIQTQRAEAGKDISFEFSIALRNDPQRVNEPRFTGPFAQGKVPDQFFYIGVGAFVGQVSGWSRRIKVPLSGVSWEMIDGLKEGKVLATNVPGAGKDGTPACATVKPFEGWRVR